ncbi:hypothetical protein OAH16_01815 [bacterium]|nr:hypothetical protein [bacterium]
MIFSGTLILTEAADEHHLLTIIKCSITVFIIPLGDFILRQNYLLAMIPVTISTLITSPAALISLCLFTIRVACSHSPHPDQQGGRHSNYLV